MCTVLLLLFFYRWYVFILAVNIALIVWHWLVGLVVRPAREEVTHRDHTFEAAGVRPADAARVCRA